MSFELYQFLLHEEHPVHPHVPVIQGLILHEQFISCFNASDLPKASNCGSSSCKAEIDCAGGEDSCGIELEDPGCWEPSMSFWSMNPGLL